MLEDMQSDLDWLATVYGIRWEIGRMSSETLQNKTLVIQQKYLSHDKEYYYEANDVAMDLERVINAVQELREQTIRKANEHQDGCMWIRLDHILALIGDKK